MIKVTHGYDNYKTNLDYFLERMYHAKKDDVSIAWFANKEDAELFSLIKNLTSPPEGVYYLYKDNLYLNTQHEFVENSLNAMKIYNYMEAYSLAQRLECFIGKYVFHLAMVRLTSK